MTEDQTDGYLELTAGNERFFGKILCFELGLAVFAVIVGWFIGTNPLARLYAKDGGWTAIAYSISIGFLCTLPMIGGLLLLDRYPIGPLRGLKQLTEERLVPLFARQSMWQLLLVSAAAGFGEEVLYRGLIQTALAHRVPVHPPVILACVIASLIFGACHYLSTTYFVLATLMGLYWGIVFEAIDSLFAPIISHTLYDFFALAYFVKWKRREAIHSEA